MMSSRNKMPTKMMVPLLVILAMIGIFAISTLLRERPVKCLPGAICIGAPIPAPAPEIKFEGSGTR